MSDSETEDCEVQKLLVENDEMKITLYWSCYESFEPGLTHVRAELILKKVQSDPVVAATLNAQIVDMHSKVSFYEICDAYSQELIEAARLVCLIDGTVRPEIASNLALTEEKLKSKPDFFYLDHVEVEKPYRGRALGLILTAAVLNHYRLSIRVAVILALYYPSDRAEREGMRESMDQKQVREDRIYRYFYCLKGFKQLSQYDQKYFVRGYYNRDEDQIVLFREEAEAIAPFYPWKRPPEPLSGLELKLRDSVVDPTATLRLLQKGADPIKADALQYAVAMKSMETVRILLSYGVDINSHGTQGEGSTALHVAVGAKDLSMVQLLIELGADVNAVNDRNETALNVAEIAEQSSKDFAATLLNRALSSKEKAEWTMLKTMLRK